jgi:signal transduction histidine kinase
MIGREALLNAFWHSGARSVDLQVVCDSKGFALCVRDNGAGLDAETRRAGHRPGHWGLSRREGGDPSESGSNWRL